MNPLEDNIQQAGLSPNQERITGIDFTPLGTPAEAPDGPTQPVISGIELIGGNIISVGENPNQIVVPPSYAMYTSTSAPDNSFGQDGDWYWMIVSSGIVRIYQKIACVWTLITQTPGGIGCPDGCPAGGDLKGSYLNPLVQNVHHVGTDASITIEDSEFIYVPSANTSTTVTINTEGIQLTDFNPNNVVHLKINGAAGIEINDADSGCALFLTPGNDNIYLRNSDDTQHFHATINQLDLHDSSLGDVVLNVDHLLINNGVTGDSGFYSSNALSISIGTTGANIELDPAGGGIIFDNSSFVLNISSAALTKNMAIKEIDVCVAGVAKKMLVIASDPY